MGWEGGGWVKGEMGGWVGWEESEAPTFFVGVSRSGVTIHENE